MKINGIDTAATFGFRMSDAPGWANMPQSRSTTAIIADRGERIVGRTLLMPRSLTLRGNIMGSSASNVRALLDRLKFEASKANVTIEFDDFPSRWLNARGDDGTVKPFGATTIARSLPLDLKFTVYDPMFYDTSESVVATTIALGTGIVRPKITLEPTVAAPPWYIDFKDYTGATVGTLTFNTAAAGEIFIIDGATQTITKDGVSILKFVDGDFFRIDPRIHADFPNSTWPTIVGRDIDSGGTLEIRYRRAWL